MEIKQLFIDGFGHFNNVALNGLSPGLSLFLGNNEAGKSTLLGFIRAMFFGFPDGRSSENPYDPLNGGQHGGYALVNTDARGEVKIERIKGKNKGMAELFFLNDSSSGNNSDLNKLLGGLSKAVFNNVFAFSLGELQSFDSLNNEDVEGALYGAGGGVSLMAIPTSLKKLEQDMGRLYKKGGSNPAINTKLTKLEEIQKKYRAAVQEVKEFEGLAKQRRELRRAIKQLHEDEEQQKKDQSRIQDYLKLWDQWIILQEEEDNLNSLPEIISEFPDDGLNRMSALSNHLNNLHQTVKKEIDKRERYQQKIEDLSIDHTLLLQADDISLLNEDLGTYSAALRDKENGLKEIEQQNDGIKRHLESLGKDWTEKKILSMDRSLFTQNSIRQHHSSLSDAEANLKQANNRLLNIREELKDKVSEEQAVKSALDKSPGLENDLDEAVIQAVQNGRDRFAGVLTDLPKRQNESKIDSRELAKAIKAIDPNWDIKAAESFDCSVTAQEKVEQFESNINTLSGEIKELSHRVDLDNDALEDLSTELSDNETKLKNLPHSPLDNKEQYLNQKQQLRAIQDNLAKKERISDTIRHKQERLADIEESQQASSTNVLTAVFTFSKFLSLLVALTGLIIFGGSFLNKLPFDGRLPGVSLFLIGILLFIGSVILEKKQAQESSRNQEANEQKKKALHEELKQHEHNLVEIEQLISNLSETFGKTPPLSASELQQLEQQLENDLAALEKKTEVLKEIERIQKSRSKTEAAIRKNIATLSVTESDMRTMKEAWKNHLQTLSLNRDTSPRAATLIFSKIETIKSKIDSLRTAEQRISGMETIKETYLDHVKKVPELADKAEGDPNHLVSAIDQFLNELKARDEIKRKRKSDLELLRDKTSSRQKTQEKEQAANLVLKAAQDALAETKQTWKNWLTDHGLDTTTSPETALSAMDTINNCIRLIDSRSELEKTVNHKEALIKDYHDLVAKVYNATGKTEPAQKKLSTEIKLLYQELGTNKSNLEKKTSLQEQLADTEKEMASLRNQLVEGNNKVDKLLKEGSAANQEVFKSRGELFQRRNHSMDIIESASRTIKVISGERDLALLKETLQKETKESLESKNRGLQSEIEEVEHKLETMRQRLADLKSKMDHLASSEEISRLRTEEEMVKEEILHEARKWGVRATARFLITRAREEFEKAHQPKVIQEAIKYFSKFTGGGYGNIIAPLGERSIEVLTRHNVKKKPQQLSRATAEQLYLSLRFGYMAKLADEGETLPVIMDDILVNFDTNRSQYAAEAIMELASNHQILFFTCHSETVEKIRALDSSVPVWRIGSGQFEKKNTQN